MTDWLRLGDAEWYTRYVRAQEEAAAAVPVAPRQLIGIGRYIPKDHMRTNDEVTQDMKPRRHLLKTMTEYELVCARELAEDGTWVRPSDDPAQWAIWRPNPSVDVAALQTALSRCIAEIERQTEDV